MRLIRRWVYQLGFRPKPGSIFFSPSMEIALKVHEAVRKAFKQLSDEGL